MKVGAASSGPVVAVLGESQVGKSSLVNALIGARLLPTTGTGAPRSQALCECLLPGLPTSPSGAWKVDLEVQPRGVIETAVQDPNGARGSLLRRDLGVVGSPDLETAWRSSHLNGASAEPILALAAGRETDWMCLGQPISPQEARRQVGPLAGGWPAAIVRRVTLTALGGPTRTVLVDLPGVGHSDVGGEATRSWLEEESSGIAAVVCVVGQSGIGEVLASLLKQFWRLEDLAARLHIVATFGDRLVEDAEVEAERLQAARTRRARATEQATKLLGSQRSGVDIWSQTYCVDPRPDTRWWKDRVEFDGELDRLRRAIASSQRPERPLSRPEPPPPPAPPVRPRSRPTPKPARPKAPPVRPLADETVQAWLARVFAPSLRAAAWKKEPARGGDDRHVLTARSKGGRTIRVVTISGSGKAWLKLSATTEEIPLPESEQEASRLLAQLLESARRNDLTNPSATGRNARGTA